jgi:hypothetical protein
LYQSAAGLFARRPPDVTLTEKCGHKTYRVQLWDTEGLPFTIENPEPVRVVRSEEVLERNRFRQGKRTKHATDHEWLWVTTLPQQAFPPIVVRQLGHSRWKNENNGWMDLTKHWAFKHGFLHACQHRPTADQCFRRARTGPQSRSGSRHFDSPDCVRIEFGFRTPPFQTRPSRSPHHDCRGSAVARLDF